MLAVLGSFAWYDQRRSERLLREELAREGRALALTAQLAVEDYLAEGRLGDIRDLVEKVSGYERVLGLRVFAPDATIMTESTVLQDQTFVHVAALREALSRRVPVETRREIDGEPVVTFIVPLSGRSNELLGALQVIQLESFIDEDTRVTRTATLRMAAVMVLATGAILLVVTRLTVTRSLEVLVSSFRGVGSGDLKARVPVRGRDELGHLAEEFNRMCGRLEAAQRALLDENEQRRRAETRLLAAEKLASLGRVAAGLAHEIGTPLNVIGGRAEALERRVSDNEDAVRSLRIIRSQIDRIARIVTGFLDFSRVREPQVDQTDAVAVVRRVVQFMEHLFDQRGIRVELDVVGTLPPLPADADQLNQVFLNLASNAVDAMPDGGVLRIACRREEQARGEGASPDAAAGGPFAAVVFADTGRGIAPEHLSRVFEPFFTTKEIGKGTGLGLAISYGIVRRHGGWIHVESSPGRGSTFTVYLPLAGGGAMREDAA
jgi:signal transduction histidine kinase